MRLFTAVPVCSMLLVASQMAFAAAPTGTPAGDGLKLQAEHEDAWPMWQARLSHTTPTLPLWNQMSGTGSGNMMLAGDRYFGWGRLGDSGGLRATGALLLGNGALNGQGGASDFFWRASHVGDEEQATAVPYLGLGYSAWWARTGLGVSADLGLAAQRPGQAVRFGRVFSGTDSLDGMLRAMQIAPMLQVNLSYAF